MVRLGLPKLWMSVGWELCDPGHEIGSGMRLGLV